MKKLNYLVVTLLTLVGIFTVSCQSRKSVDLKTGIDSASYAIGILNGGSFKQNLATLPETVSTDALLAGFEESFRDENDKFKMTPEEAQTFIQAYFSSAQERINNKNKEEGAKFLEENKTKPGVITTESGLQYQVITEGTGPKPKETDRVKVHYTGTTLDGTVFDSSIDRGEPMTFGVNQVIKGWTEGLQIMPVGSKYIFWIPSDLAYGEQHRSAEITPNSMLKFEVELLEIVEE